MPNATARSFGRVNAVVKSESAAGAINAAIEPWSARAANSIAWSSATPANVDAAAKRIADYTGRKRIFIIGLIAMSSSATAIVAKANHRLGPSSGWLFRSTDYPRTISLRGRPQREMSRRSGSSHSTTRIGQVAR